MQGRRCGNAQCLAERYGVAERTIYRDLEILADLGIPYHFDDAAGGYRIHGGFFLPPVHLTADEVLALATLAERVGGSEQVPFTRPAASALEKLRGAIPDKVRRQLGGLPLGIARPIDADLQRVIFRVRLLGDQDPKPRRADRLRQFHRVTCPHGRRPGHVELDRQKFTYIGRACTSRDAPSRHAWTVPSVTLSNTAVKPMA